MNAKENSLRYIVRKFSWQFKITGFVLSISACLLTSGVKAQEIRRAFSNNRAIIPSSPQIRSSADEQAKFLAGISLPRNSGLSMLQSTAFYRAHAGQFSKMWSNFNATHFNKMQIWSKNELQPKLPRVPVLLYAFGGPDFINAFALFPNMPTMILCGLEPIGNIGTLGQLDERRLAGLLAALRTATDSTLKWSFFIRKDMKEDLQQGDFRGVLPILYAFLALSESSIVQTEFIRAGGFPAVRIIYRRARSSSNQVLYYVNANLANGATGNLFSWLSSFGPSIGYLKAASYLMHQQDFSSIRKFLLKDCLAILQDDSGIPFQYFVSDWKIYLYGKYTQPIELFKSHYQPDLRAAYQTSGTVDFLPFGTGYQWRPGDSNLMLAVRRQ